MGTEPGMMDFWGKSHPRTERELFQKQHGFVFFTENVSNNTENKQTGSV